MILLTGKSEEKSVHRFVETNRKIICLTYYNCFLWEMYEFIMYICIQNKRSLVE